MNAGTLVGLSYLNITASLGTLNAPREPMELPEQASERAEDAVALSPRGKEAFGARVQLELEITSLRVIQGTFSEGDEEGADALGPWRRFQGIFKDATAFAGLEAPQGTEGVPDLFAKLREFYSPERTADRIFQFATTHYGKGSFTGEDSEAMRTRYRDFILPAIEQGFAEARATLGTLPEEVGVEVDRTFQLIQEAFERFVTGDAEA